MKTDDAQLILASAVIPMPGACVFPTTTSRSSAAAADGSGRGSTQSWEKFKGDYKLLRGTRGSPSFPFTQCDCVRVGNCGSKVGGSNPPRRRGKCGRGCLSPFALLDTNQTLV